MRKSDEQEGVKLLTGVEKRKDGVSVVENKIKIIFDLVHGYVEIDQDVESIIDTASFQRLKFIGQLTARHLFPSANHTRFEHSLGVMKLANDAYCHISKELKSNIEEHILGHSDFLREHSIEDRLLFLQMHLQYAALLHDVGHAPLSHIGEKFYVKEEIETNLSTFGVDKASTEKGSAHELMSCYVIAKNFREQLNSIFSSLKNPRIQLDLDFICRIITGTKYCGREAKSWRNFWDRNIIIELINGTFDVDKMDYLMRDNYMTGNVGGFIDKQRILSFLAISETKHVCFKIGALSSLKKLIDCRDSLYMWVCNHHIVVYTDYLYAQCLSHLFSLYQEENNLFSNPSLYPEAVNKKELFSCEAIADKKVTDNDVYYYIQRATNLCRSKDENIHATTPILLNQLTDRTFLKTSWKTLFDYNQFLKRFSDINRDKVPKFVQNDEARSSLQTHIEEKLSIRKGELAIPHKQNNFYDISELYIYKNENGTKKAYKLKELLPPRDYKLLCGDVAFYVFVKDKAIMNRVLEYFVQYVNENIHDFLQQ
ncbi:MAG: HD domain-containing protein [Kiritimatiellaeota bacterium]|nr:HD domain-containing protein [Kiritimatiellota bacterium]